MVTLGDVSSAAERLSGDQLMEALALILARVDELGDIVERLMEDVLTSIPEES